MKRTEARELAFKTIYSKFFNADQEVDFDNSTESDLKYLNGVLDNFATHFEEINTLIESHLKCYTLSRVYKVDLAIIVLAVIEVKYLETPKQVAVNEAVELSKKYSTDKSPKFINGVLADILN